MFCKRILKLSRASGCLHRIRSQSYICRIGSSVPLRLCHDFASMSEYHRAANAVVDLLEDRFCKIQSDLESPYIADVVSSDGVLTVSLPGTGTFVINKQPPLRELWLSSPLTGPFHYKFAHEVEGHGPPTDPGSWVNSAVPGALPHSIDSLDGRLSADFSRLLPRDYPAFHDIPPS